MSRSTVTPKRTSRQKKASPSVTKSTPKPNEVHGSSVPAANDNRTLGAELELLIYGTDEGEEPIDALYTTLATVEDRYRQVSTGLLRGWACTRVYLNPERGPEEEERARILDHNIAEVATLLHGLGDEIEWVRKAIAKVGDLARRIRKAEEGTDG